MTKFENIFIVLAIAICFCSIVFQWGEDGQAIALCVFLASLFVKHLALQAEDIRKTREMGEPYNRNDNNK